MIETTKELTAFKNKFTALFGLMDKLIVAGGRDRLAEVMNQSGYTTGPRDIEEVLGVHINMAGDTPQIVVTYQFNDSEREELAMGTFYIESDDFGNFEGDF